MWDSCPIQASKQDDDDPGMRVLLGAAEEDHEAYRIITTSRAKLASEKEISLCHLDLRKAYFAYTKKLTHEYVATATVQMLDKGPEKGMELTINELTHKMAYNLLSRFPVEGSNSLGFKCGELKQESARNIEYLVEESADIKSYICHNR